MSKKTNMPKPEVFPAALIRSCGVWCDWHKEVNCGIHNAGTVTLWELVMMDIRCKTMLRTSFGFAA